MQVLVTWPPDAPAPALFHSALTLCGVSVRDEELPKHMLDLHFYISAFVFVVIVCLCSHHECLEEGIELHHVGGGLFKRNSASPSLYLYVYMHVLLDLCIWRAP